MTPTVLKQVHSMPKNERKMCEKKKENSNENEAQIAEKILNSPTEI